MHVLYTFRVQHFLVSSTTNRILPKKHLTSRQTFDQSHLRKALSHHSSLLNANLLKTTKKFLIYQLPFYLKNFKLLKTWRLHNLMLSQSYFFHSKFLIYSQNRKVLNYCLYFIKNSLKTNSPALKRMFLETETKLNRGWNKLH